MASKPATTTKKAAAPKAVAKTTAAAPKVVAKKPGKPIPAPVKKPAPKAVPKKVAETVTLKTVFEQLAEAHDLPKKLGHTLLTDLVASVTGILKNGDRVRMSGLGIIEVKDRPARMGRNPATGAVIPIAASRKVAFRAAKELKEAV
jgi:DNA-binding protein HU-beta